MATPASNSETQNGVLKPDLFQYFSKNCYEPVKLFVMNDTANYMLYGRFY